MDGQSSLLREGFRRMWRYQRVLWWTFFISLVLSHFGAGPATHKLDWSLDHSLQAKSLVRVFDLGAFSELSSNQEVRLFEVAGVSMSFAIVFFWIALFLVGGTLEAYRSGRKLNTREFFEACGNYFWRWVRLLILMAIVLLPFLMALQSLSSWAAKKLTNAFDERTGSWLLLVIWIAFWLVASCIRLWFDMAQVRAVADEEFGMWRNAGSAFRLTFSNFGTLFWMYARISLSWWVLFAAAFFVWTKMPPARYGLSFLILELVVLWGFATRLWQRACEMTWYQNRMLAQVVTPVPVTPTPDPLLAITPAPAAPQP